MSAQTQTYGRGLYVGALVFFSVLSVAGNAVYAYRAAPPPVDGALSPAWAAAAHTIPPVALLLVTEVVAAASTRLPGGWPRRVGLGGAAVIAVAAFVLSFDALYAVAEMAKVRGELAWLVPVMLDMAIVVTTVLVLAASDRMRADVQATTQPVESTTAGSTTSHPVVVADGLVVDHRPVGDQPATTTATTQPVDVDDRPVVDPVEVVDHPQEPQVSDVAVESTTTTATESPTGVEVVDRVGDRPATTPSADVVDPVDDQPAAATGLVADLAARVHAATATTKPVEAVVEVLRRAAEGESQRAIATAAGVDRSLVRRWTAAAKELEDDRRRPVLMAVNNN